MAEWRKTDPEAGEKSRLDPPTGVPGVGPRSRCCALRSPEGWVVGRAIDAWRPGTAANRTIAACCRSRSSCSNQQGWAGLPLEEISTG